jgi:aflatoxin B1 aldehyde reductase
LIVLNIYHISEEFGLSNFAAYEVAQIWTICKERGYVLPTVYQGAYNLIQRGAEAE